MLRLSMLQRSSSENDELFYSCEVLHVMEGGVPFGPTDFGLGLCRQVGGK